MSAITETLSSMGTPEARERSDALLRGGVAALTDLFTALAADAPVGAPHGNGRAVMEDLESCLVQFARAHPEDFIDGIERHARLARQFAVLSAIGSCPSPRAVPHLLAALADRSGSMRWLALSALLARDAPELEPHFTALLGDRDGLVVFVATRALRRRGTSEHLPRLVSIAENQHTAVGTREAAYDAIESIALREGLPLPEGCPAPRLFELELPSSATPSVTESMLVKAGERVASSPEGDVVAPFTALVIEVGRSSLLLRREPSRGR